MPLPVPELYHQNYSRYSLMRVQCSCSPPCFQFCRNVVRNNQLIFICLPKKWQSSSQGSEAGVPTWSWCCALPLATHNPHCAARDWRQRSSGLARHWEFESNRHQKWAGIPLLRQAQQADLWEWESQLPWLSCSWIGGARSASQAIGESLSWRVDLSKRLILSLSVDYD